MLEMYFYANQKPDGSYDVKIDFWKNGKNRGHVPFSGLTRKRKAIVREFVDACDEMLTFRKNDDGSTDVVFYDKNFVKFYAETKTPELYYNVANDQFTLTEYLTAIIYVAEEFDIEVDIFSDEPYKIEKRGGSDIYDHISYGIRRGRRLVAKIQKNKK
ncbi:MAG: hypothetical protein IKE91_03320 [Clostridia bacterium]|nr:hypothetical protein [Clostridia bacterium]